MDFVLPILHHMSGSLPGLFLLEHMSHLILLSLASEGRSFRLAHNRSLYLGS